MGNLISKPDRTNKERYNTSLKSLYNLGMDVYAITGLQAIYSEYIQPSYIEEYFTDSLGIRWVFKIDRGHKKANVNKKRYRISSWEELMQQCKVMDGMSPDTESERQLLKEIRLTELMGLALQQFKDTGWTSEPAHFVLGKKDKAVEFFIGVAESQLSENYNNKNIFRDL